MKLQIPEPLATPEPELDGSAVAGMNRQLLRDAKVFCVSLVGGPGCGKSALIEQSLRRLPPGVRVAVVSGDPRRPRDGHAAHPSARWVHADVDGGGWLEPHSVRDALSHIDLPATDLLFIENVGSLTVPCHCLDVGQDAAVTVFSVAGGDDKADKHPDLVSSSDALVLNKTDLLLLIPFDIARFRQDVRRNRPDAPLFELSSLSGRGMNPWLNWLLHHLRKGRSAHDDASHWFG